MVVDAAELIEELLEVFGGFGWGLGCDSVFEGLLEPFDFAAGGGPVGA